MGLVFGRLLPKGFARESFAGKKAHRLDEQRLAELNRWVESGMKALKIPGVAVGVVQDGKVVFAGGFGVRTLGEPKAPDADTLFMIASNTKALTTLLLARLVDEKKLTWETPVTSVLPTFKLGDAETTKKVLVKHLICACTGLPRQDLEWLFEFGDLIGHHSDMMWLPEHGVGAVIRTNGDGGSSLRTTFRRKLLEVLFDGQPEADAQIASAARSLFTRLEAERKLMTIPAAAEESGKLAARYRNPALGAVAVSRKGSATLFDFGEWKSEVASRKNPDGTVSFLTIAPGVLEFEFVVGTAGEKKTLVTRDAQHEYVFTEE